MRWTDRQRAMLLEMGIRLWPDATSNGASEAAETQLEVKSAQHALTPPPEQERSATAVVLPTAADLQQAPVPVRDDAVPISSGLSAMDWPELQVAVSRCTACRLCEARRQTVFGVGNRRAHWMIVGEAPGEQEDLAGEPFVGKSGQLLDNMLRAIQLTRDEAAPQRQVYIANTVKCRPPGNRNPQPDELARCEPYLIRQLDLVRPRIILAMGRFAVQSLLRSSEPIGKLRGRVHDYRGVPLIVTYHPAYLLRNLPDKARAWDDLCLAVETVKTCTGP